MHRVEGKKAQHRTGDQETTIQQIVRRRFRISSCSSYEHLLLHKRLVDSGSTIRSLILNEVLLLLFPGMGLTYQNGMTFYNTGAPAPATPVAPPADPAQLYQATSVFGENLKTDYFLIREMYKHVFQDTKRLLDTKRSPQ